MCIFCKIIHNEINSYKVYEDEQVLAILDISQATKGHTLILPKNHSDNLLTINPNDLEAVMKVAQKLAKHYQQVLPNIAGFNLINNAGEVAGQTVMHFHVHLIPRYLGDDFINMQANDHGKETDFADLQAKLKL